MTLEKLDFDVKNKTDFSKILTSVEMQAKRKILSLIEIQKNWKEFKEFLEENGFKKFSDFYNIKISAFKGLLDKNKEFAIFYYNATWDAFWQIKFESIIRFAEMIWIWSKHIEISREQKILKENKPKNFPEIKKDEEIEISARQNFLWNNFEITEEDKKEFREFFMQNWFETYYDFSLLTVEQFQRLLNKNCKLRKRYCKLMTVRFMKIKSKSFLVFVEKLWFENDEVQLKKDIISLLNNNWIFYKNSKFNLESLRRNLATHSNVIYFFHKSINKHPKNVWHSDLQHIFEILWFVDN